MLLNILQCIGQLPPPRVILPTMSTELRGRNPDLEDDIGAYFLVLFISDSPTPSLLA
jgi:hypothetical protein